MRRCKHLSAPVRRAPPSESSQQSSSGLSQTPVGLEKLSRRRESQAEVGEEPVARKRQKLQIEHEHMLTVEATQLERKKDCRGPGGFSYRCLTCNKVTFMRIRAVAHAAKCSKKSTVRKQRRKKILPCNVCGETFGTVMAVKRHRRLRHPHLLHHKKCTCCMRSFSSIDHYKRHIVRRKSSVFFKCGKCFKQFSTPTNLKRHVNDRHQIEETVVASQPLLDEATARLSRSVHLSEAVRSRNAVILSFTDKLIRRARELGESDRRIEEIKRIQLKKLILPEAEHPARLALPPPTNCRSRQAPQVSLPTSHQSQHYSLRRESSSPPSYREGSNELPSLHSSSAQTFAPSSPPHSAASACTPTPPSASSATSACTPTPPSASSGTSACTPTPPSASSGDSFGDNDGSSPTTHTPVSRFSQRDFRFKCTICPDLWFRDRYNLDRHNQVHDALHDHSTITCLRAWCTEEFSTTFERATHMKDCVWTCPEPLCDKYSCAIFGAF